MDCIELLLVTEDKIQLRKKSFECQLGKATMQKSGPAQCDEQKDAVSGQEAAAGPAGPSNPGVLASESSSVSVPQAVLSVNRLDPLRNNVRRKMYEIVFNIINTGTAPEAICLSSLGLGIYYLGKLKPDELLESFPLREEIDQMMELMLAKILLKFGAAQATCRDDDEHIMSQLFKSKKEKDLLRRMEPQLLMCVFND